MQLICVCYFAVFILWLNLNATVFRTYCLLANCITICRSLLNSIVYQLAILAVVSTFVILMHFIVLYYCITTTTTTFI